MLLTLVEFALNYHSRKIANSWRGLHNRNVLCFLFSLFNAHMLNVKYSIKTRVSHDIGHQAEKLPFWILDLLC